MFEDNIDLYSWLEKNCDNVDILEQKWYELLKIGNLEDINLFIDYNGNDIYYSLLNDEMSSNVAELLSSKITSDVFSDNMCEEDFKELLKRGYFVVCSNLLTGVYFNWDNYDSYLIIKYVVKYGNYMLVELISNLDLFNIVNNLDPNVSYIHTWIWYLLKPSLNPYDNSIERYTMCFNKIIENIEIGLQLCNDMIDRFDKIIEFPSILEFFIDNYKDKTSNGSLLNTYIICILSNNLNVITLLDKFFENKNIELEDDIIIGTLCSYKCDKIEFLQNLVDKFSLTSYILFCISISKDGLFLENECIGNKNLFLKLYTDLYSNITTENILKFYRLHIELDNEYPEILTDCLQYNPNLNLDVNFFKDFRNMIVTNYNLDDECDVLPYSATLEFMCETYGDKFYLEYNIQSDEYYYLLLDESPYSLEDYEFNRCAFFEISRNPVITKKTCLICLDEIPDIYIKSCDTNNFLDGHIYCETCLSKWLVDGVRKCPVCRNKLF
jgi:hypothetical protein